MGVGKDEDYGAVVGYEPTTAGECGNGTVPITSLIENLECDSLIRTYEYRTHPQTLLGLSPRRCGILNCDRSNAERKRRFNILLSTLPTGYCVSVVIRGVFPFILPRRL